MKRHLSSSFIQPFSAFFRQYHISILLILIIILSALLRVWNIGREPLWLDEGWSYWWSSQTLKDLWTTIPKEAAHPSFYYSLLKIWRYIFGDSESSLRSLSALFSIITTPTIFLLGFNLGGKRYGVKVGLISAFLFATSPLHVQYAQEARTYALFTFSVALSCAGLTWFLKEDTDHQVFSEYDGNLFTKNSIFPGLFFVLGTAFALWSHNLGVLFAMSLGGIFLFLSLNSSFGKKVNFFRFLILWGLIILLWSPHLYNLFNQISSVLDGYWLQKPDFWNAFLKVKNLLGIAYVRHDFLLLVPITCAGIWFCWRKRGTNTVVFLIGLILLPVFLDFAITFLVTPVFLKRTLMWITIPSFILTGFGIVALPNKYLRGLAVLLLGAMTLTGTLNYYKMHSKEPFDKIVFTTQSVEKQKTAVILYPNYLEVLYRYYLNKLDDGYENNKLIMLPHSFINEPHFGHKIKREDSFLVNRRITDYHVIWVVHRRKDLHDPNDYILSGLSEIGYVETQKMDWKGITVIRLQKAI